MYGYTSQAIRDLIASKWDTVESQEDRLGEFLFFVALFITINFSRHWEYEKKAFL